MLWETIALVVVLVGCLILSMSALLDAAADSPASDAPTAPVCGGGFEFHRVPLRNTHRLHGKHRAW